MLKPDDAEEEEYEEQIEEESTVSEILAQIRMVGDDGPGLLRLDADLGARQAQGTEPA